MTVDDSPAELVSLAAVDLDGDGDLDPVTDGPSGLYRLINAGSHADRIVGRKTRVARLPGLQQLDALVGEQVSSNEKRDHFLPEEKLGGVSVNPPS